MSFSCRICGSTELELVIDLGKQPWGNNFLKKEEIGKEQFYPLEVVYCRKCQTVQLNYTVAKEVMFADHTYLSGVTKSLSDHFKETARCTDELFFKNCRSKSILDVGSNDGTLLKHFKELNYDVLGVESSKTISGIANDAGIPTLNRFFNLETAHDINRKFNLINASGILFHLEELHSVLEGIKFALDKNGVFIIQFLYLKKIVENCAFDQIYHEHLLYYNIKNLDYLLRLHGLGIFDAKLSPIHGGSIIAYAAHTEISRPMSERLRTLIAEEDTAACNEIRTYLHFAERIKTMKNFNLDFLNKRKSEGMRIFGLGAPVKGNTLLNYFGVGTQYLDCLTERNVLRKNLYSPGMHIPVVMEEELITQPDCYYVLAWNFKNEILARNKALLDQGIEFYFPVNPEQI